MTETPAPAQDPPDAVLARITAAHHRGAIAARDRSDALSTVWTRALRHAGQPFGGLNVTVRTVAVTEYAELTVALETLPEHGLISVLEDRDGRRGLIALSHGVVDALVEVQTTGKVELRDHPPRRVTRIDEALSRDFIDLCLAALSHETDTMEDRDWPGRMTYGSHIADRRQLTLLMPEGRYHVLSAELDLGEDGKREGRAVIALPSDPNLVEGRPTPPQGRAPGPPPEAWRSELAAMLVDVEIPFEAILLRSTRSLRDVERLAEGDLIPFSEVDLGAVDLQTSRGTHLLTGRLGQMNGHRALRVHETPVHAGPARAAGVRLPLEGSGASVGLVEQIPTLDNAADPERGSLDLPGPDQTAPPTSPADELAAPPAMPMPLDATLPEEEGRGTSTKARASAPAPLPASDGAIEDPSVPALGFAPQVAPIDLGNLPD